MQNKDVDKKLTAMVLDKPSLPVITPQKENIGIAVGRVLDPSKPSHVEEIIKEHKTIRDFKSTSNGKLKVLKNEIGFAIVAAKKIKKNKKNNKPICKFRGEIREITEEEFSQKTKDVHNYAYEIERSKGKIRMIFADSIASEVSLINCSYDGYHNVEIRFSEEGGAELYATRSISPGEELLLHYGKKYVGSENFHHIFPIGSRSIDDFIKANKSHYAPKKIKLTEHECQILNTDATHVLVPKSYSQAKKTWKKDDIDRLNLFPIIELKEKSGQGLQPLKDQQFITPFMYACLKKDTDRINILKNGANICFVTKKSCSAWSIISANYIEPGNIDSLCRDIVRKIKTIYAENNWSKAFRQYILDNSKHAKLEDVAVILAMTRKRKAKPYLWDKKGGSKKKTKPINTDLKLTGEENSVNKSKYETIPSIFKHDERPQSPNLQDEIIKSPQVIQTAAQSAPLAGSESENLIPLSPPEDAKQQLISLTNKTQDITAEIQPLSLSPPTAKDEKKNKKQSILFWGNVSQQFIYSMDRLISVTQQMQPLSLRTVDHPPPVLIAPQTLKKRKKSEATKPLQERLSFSQSEVIDLTDDPAPSFLEAIKKGDSCAAGNLCRIMKQRGEINTVYPDEGTALHIAITTLVIKSHLSERVDTYFSIIKNLVDIEYGNIDTTIKDNLGKTARDMLAMINRNLKHSQNYQEILMLLSDSESRHMQQMVLRSHASVINGTSSYFKFKPDTTDSPAILIPFQPPCQGQLK